MLLKKALNLYGNYGLTEASGIWDAYLESAINDFRKKEGNGSGESTVFKDVALKKLIAALKSRGFSKGGMIDAKNLRRLTGEDGFALVSHGEAILTPEQAEQFKRLASNIPQLNKVVSPFANATITRQNTPNIQIDSSIHVDGVATDTLVGQMAGIAKKQAENSIREMNRQLYDKGARR